MEIIDAHHHLWDTNLLDYPMFAGNATLERPYLAADFDALADGLGVGRSVLVEAAAAGADGRAELPWLRQQADASKHVTRIVAWAPLEQPDCGGYFDWLDGLGDERIVGVRRAFEQEPPDFAARADVIAGTRLAGERGYTVDLVFYHPALAAVITLVRSCPDVQFILDHLGKPGVRDGLFSPWGEQIAALAALDNVVCKVSGLITEADHELWSREQLKPYIDHVISRFGWERVMFGSDWPVCNVAGGYARWLDALKWAVDGASEDEQHALFNATARRIYRFS